MTINDLKKAVDKAKDDIISQVTEHLKHMRECGEECHLLGAYGKGKFYEVVQDWVGEYLVDYNGEDIVELVDHDEFDEYMDYVVEVFSPTNAWKHLVQLGVL